MCQKSKKSQATKFTYKIHKETITQKNFLKWKFLFAKKLSSGENVQIIRTIRTSHNKEHPGDMDNANDQKVFRIFYGLFKQNSASLCLNKNLY